MTQVEHVVLAINPGATSTKLALYQGDNLVADQVVRHGDEELAGFETVADQVELRSAAVRTFLAEAKPERLDAVVYRSEKARAF